jgi:cytochrome c peroxidase
MRQAQQMKKLHRVRLFVFVATLSCAAPQLLAIADDNARLGLPTIVAPVDNPSSPLKVALGQTLFFDKRLSSDDSISCASCHQPGHAFSDGRKLAQGVAKRAGTRNTPSIINAAFNTSQFWDGRRPSLETQALDPLFNTREHALTDRQILLTRLRQDVKYANAFKAAFDVSPEAIQMEQVGQALASFERTVLIAGDSPFDRYHYGGDKSRLSPSAERGLALFQGSAQCATCHVIGKTSALFTDNAFHSLSVGLQRIEQRLPEITTRLVYLRENGAHLDQTVLRDEDVAELGRFAVTLRPADIGKFRTPSLRNVALTAPYMHDGSVATLNQAVELEIYYRSAEAGRPLILTPAEKLDLVAFLNSLNSPVTTHFDGSN